MFWRISIADRMREINPNRQARRGILKLVAIGNTRKLTPTERQELCDLLLVRPETLLDP